MLKWLKGLFSRSSNDGGVLVVTKDSGFVPSLHCNSKFCVEGSSKYSDGRTYKDNNFMYMYLSQSLDAGTKFVVDGVNFYSEYAGETDDPMVFTVESSLGGKVKSYPAAVPLGRYRNVTRGPMMGDKVRIIEG